MFWMCPPESIEWLVEDQAFLWSYDLAPRPLRLSHQQARPATHRKTEKERHLADGNWRGKGLGGGRWDESYDFKKAWSSTKKHSILSAFHCLQILMLYKWRLHDVSLLYCASLILPFVCPEPNENLLKSCLISECFFVFFYRSNKHILRVLYVLRLHIRARICEPCKEPRNRFPAWLNRFLGIYYWAS